MRILFSGRPFYRHQYAQLNPTGLTMVIMNYVPHDPLLLSRSSRSAPIIVTFALCTTTGPIFEGGVVCCVYITHT